MKIIIYTLNANGTIPDYVVDGGYLPVPNNNLSPQDWDLVGVAIDSALQEGFVSKEELLTYAQSKGFTNYTNPLTEQVFLLSDTIDIIWAKLDNN